MKVGELRRASYKKHASHRINSWSIGILCGLFCGGVVLLDLFVPMLTLFTVPLLILPCIFACALMSGILNEGGQLTVGNFFKSFLAFFRPPFNSSFNWIKNFLKTLLLTIIVGILSLIAVYTVFSIIYKDAFFTAINNVYEVYMAEETTIEELYDSLLANDALVWKLLIFAVEPTFFFGVFTYLFFLGRESSSIYLRVRLSSRHPYFLRDVTAETISRTGKEYNKCYIGLNFPLYILFVIGIVVGVIICGFDYLEPLKCLTVGVAIGFGLCSLFFPFYFDNNETLYNAFEEEYKKSCSICIEKLIKRMEYVTDMSDEMKNKVREEMNNTDPLRDERNNSSNKNEQDDTNE